MRSMSIEPTGSGGDALSEGTPTGDEAFDLSMAVSQLASNNTDVRIMLKLLVSQLGEVLGDRMTVERAGRFRKSDDIKSVRVSLGDDTLEAVVDGDAHVAAISAASILAKTCRDAMMQALDACYPGFDLAVHKGYGTPAHLEALRGREPSPQHRRSFSPMKLDGEPLTLEGCEP